MKFQELRLRCACGLAPARIQRIGLTPKHELVIHWRCAVCRNHVYVLKALADCWRECPDLDGSSPPADFCVESTEAADAEFLRALGIRSPGAGED